MEDILEEIVGKIQDEYDEEDRFIVKTGKDRFVADGMTPLDELSELLDIHFEEDLEVDTLNGFMIMKMEHIPEEKECFSMEYEGYEFQIRQVEKRVIRSVLITKQAPPPEQKEVEEKGEKRMSGHSKFANIKHKKEKNDAAKGKIFTIIGREIAVAVKEGGPDPANNFKLAGVIAKAKANNMPNDTIERGIKKAAGDLGNVNYEYVTYEGYGPGGIAVIVEALTDNKNRTAANVRSAFTKGSGSIGTQGCVSFMFDRKGQIIIDKEECDMDADDLMMCALDAGAEDFSEEEDSFEILTGPDEFPAVTKALEEAGVVSVSAEVTMIPQNYVTLNDEKDIGQLQRTLDLLDEDDDVQAVYHNWDEN